MENLTETLLVTWILMSTGLLIYVVIELIATKRSCKKLKNEIDEMKRPKINTEESDFIEISNGRKVLRRKLPPESRFDCSEFELKEHENQCGGCQTDGHYLCANCKHIAGFEDMDLSDNRMSYYPKQYKEEIEQMGEFEKIGRVEGEQCNRLGCEGVLEYSQPENCSCHINPPCSDCASTYLLCPVCGWEDEKP